MAGRRTRARGALLAGALACALWSSGAQAAGPTASLRVRVSPARPGARALIHFGFRIEARGTELPPALTRLSVELPRGLKMNTAGVATCRASRLESGRACSPDAEVGQGSVAALEPLGEAVRRERATLTVYNGPRARGRPTLVFCALGRLPLEVRIVFSATIAQGPRGLSIQAGIPPEPTLPGSPDAAIVSLSSTLGTLGRRYFATAGHRRVAVDPAGVTLPARCPAAGLPFAAAFQFQQGAAATARALAACGA